MSGASITQLPDKRFKSPALLPGPLYCAEGVLTSAPRLFDELGLRTPLLVVADENTRSIAGDVLAAPFSRNEVHFHIISDASVDEVARAEQTIARSQARTVMGLGGGRPIDVAKLTAYRRGLPFISAPTAPSHDGVASGRASLVHLGTRTSIRARPPVAVMADLDVLSKAPSRLVSSGCADAISNITAVMDWDLSNRVTGERVDKKARELSLHAGNMLVEGENPKDVGILIRALYDSGRAMALVGTSRPASGAEHKFAHAAEALGNGEFMHGELCGLGLLISAYLHGTDPTPLREALKRAGAPVTAKTLNIKEEVLAEALLKASEIHPERYTILEHVRLDRDGAREAARRAGLI